MTNQENTVKKVYEAPVMEISQLEEVDIIMSSIIRMKTTAAKQSRMASFSNVWDTGS